MIFWILLVFGVVATLVGTFFLVDEMFDSTVGRIIGAPFVFIGGGFVVGFFLAMVYFPLGFWAGNYAYHDSDTSSDLRAINMGDQTTGRFFLGSGVINGENVYTYFYVNKGGNAQSGRIDADSAEVVESDTEDPRIVTHNWRMPWWYGPFDLGETYTIYVPEGSITSTYNLDLPE